MEDNPVVYSYLRFSTRAQSEGDSLRRQTSLRDAWVHKNNAKLDTSLTMSDLGVSGYTGEHRCNPDRHGLAAFIEAVRVGKVRPGSYLIVENLDRLTREDAVPALHLFTGILMAGIRIVQLLPSEVIYTQKTDTFEIMRAILELSRGNSESRMKSARFTEVWAEKRKCAAESRKIVTGNLPAWIRREGGSLILIPERVEIVRRIYRWAREGLGALAIAKRLNGESVPTFYTRGKKGLGQKWSMSMVYKLLQSRAVYGCYQPCRLDSRPARKLGSVPGSKVKIRVPAGEMLSDYYPAIITEEEWFAAQAAAQSRRKGGGRIGKHVNLFSCLLVDARDGGRMSAETAYKRRAQIHSQNARKGTIQGVYFPADVFERAILSGLAEIDPASILPDAEGSRVDAVEGELGTVKIRLAKLKALLLEEEELEELVGAVRELTRRKEGLEAELVEQKARVAGAGRGQWANVKSLVEQMDAPTWGLDDRLRLRGAIRRVVKEVRVLIVRLSLRGPAVLLARLTFHQSAAVRTYWIDYLPAHNTRGPERWDCRSLRHEEGWADDIDTTEGAERVGRIVLELLRRA